MPSRIRLPHDETDANKRYSMPDPDNLPEALRAFNFWLFHEGAEQPTRSELLQVYSMAQGYMDLTTYELGQECCVGKLRDIWRARRARAGT